MFRLFSGDDNAVFSNRSVKNIKISAKANESDEWTEVLDAADIPICNINKTLEYESYVDSQAVNQRSESDPDFKDAIFLQEESFAHVHVPSLVVPRDQDMNVIHSGHPDQQPAQGYVVDVYPDFVKLTGLEFNLRLFDADQRKGLARIDNRYVAECGMRKPYCIELEYIESSGTQWIDTGVELRGGDMIEFTWANATTYWNRPTNENKGWGANNGSTSNGITGGGRTNESGTVQFLVNGTEWPTWPELRGQTIKIGEKFTDTFMLTNQAWYTIYRHSDATTYRPFTTKDLSNQDTVNSVKLCADLPGSSPFYGAKRLFSWKHRRNGILIRDLIPVSKDGIGYMYDKISE